MAAWRACLAAWIPQNKSFKAFSESKFRSPSYKLDISLVIQLAMSTFSIQINAQSESAPIGELLDGAGAASIRIFQNDPASAGVDSVQLNPFSAMPPNGESSRAGQFEFGNLRCVAQSCVSDVSLMGNIEPADYSTTQALVQSSYHGDLAAMNDESGFTRIHADLLAVLPKVDLALAGNLSQTELAQLIADVQSQVLELNTLGA